MFLFCGRCWQSVFHMHFTSIASSSQLSAQAVQILQAVQAVHKQAPAAKWAAHWRAARTKSAHNLYCSALSFIAIGGWILCRLGECCITGSHHRNGPTPVQQPPSLSDCLTCLKDSLADTICTCTYTPFPVSQNLGLVSKSEQHWERSHVKEL